MAFTKHGHQIIGTPAEADRPEQVARCGGPLLCSLCSLDSIRGLSEYMKSVEPATIKAKHWDEQGNLCLGETRLKPVGWMIFGGRNDQKIVRELEDIHVGVPHGSFTRVYIVLDTD